MTKYFLELGAASRHINMGNVVGARALNQDGIYMWLPGRGLWNLETIHK